MSLFDVIKYPISSPPTKEELNDLPTRVYRRWHKLSSWNRFKFSRADVVRYYIMCGREHLMQETDYSDIEVLKGVILRLRK
jgi:hypothetical protein